MEDEDKALAEKVAHGRHHARAWTNTERTLAREVLRLSEENKRLVRERNWQRGVNRELLDLVKPDPKKRRTLLARINDGD